LAEPVTSLLGRFRQVEVTCETQAAVPASVPSSWLLPQATGPVLQFVDSTFSDDELQAKVRGLVPDARDIQVAPMALRQIFITLARVYRVTE
jgi:ABC-2 type transport system ATP-binding protein